MKQLYLLRHAEPEPDSLTGEDHDRSLTNKGIADAEKLGGLMKEAQYVPNMTLCSSSLCTVQTQSGVFGVLFGQDTRSPVKHDRDFYLASAEKLLTEIELTSNDVNRLLVVGHNPGISDLALSMAGTDHMAELGGYPPCSLTIFDCEIENWTDLTLQAAHFRKYLLP